MFRYKVILTTLATLVLLSNFSQAQDLSVTDPSLHLNGNNINLNFNIAGVQPASRDVKIMFCDCSNFTESSIIQNANDWYIGSANNKSTVKTMIQEGWFIQSAFNLNAKQFYIVFVK